MNKPTLFATAAALIAGSSIVLAQTTPPGAQPRPAPTLPTTATTVNSAKAQIEASGYSNVKDLRRQDDGSWLARATKNNTEVAVSVDTKGTVTQMAQ